MKLLYSCLLILLSSISLNAQDKRDNILAVGISYGYNIPAMDLADRFGSSFMAGLDLSYILVEKKAIIDLEYDFIFGKNIKESVYGPLLTENGQILGTDGSYAQVLLRNRGAYFGVNFSKIIAIGHPYSGLKIGVGCGLLQHKIRVQVDTNNVPIFTGEYLKGYDRNTIGPALKQILAYHRTGTDHKVNYSIQFEVTEGFTKSNRPVDFDTMLNSNSSRLDLLATIKFKWYLPIGKYRNPEEIFY